MNRRILSTLFFALFVLVVFAQTNDKRIALVIGNSNYQNGGSLKNPVNDAELMAKTLQELGFTVIKKLNANLRTMQIASTDFKSKLKDYDVALFFYAGHGIQVDGINYLVPVDAALENREMAKYDAFSVNDINDAFLSNTKNINIMILDACRNDPYRSWARGGERGFTRIDNPSRGVIIAFATQSGETAADGDGNNGLYTSKLVQQMKVPQSIESVFKETRKAVNAASNGKQVPQDWSSLMDDFYFKKTNGSITINPDEGFVQGNDAEDYGSISIDSEIGGTLYIDGEYKGNIIANSTGNRLTKIAKGIHSLKIEGDENWTKNIVVIDGQILHVDIKTTRVKDLSNQLFDRRDNKYYKTVKIGNQIWMAENLAFDAGQNCWAYDNDRVNVAKYGYLYNWETAKIVCPPGWMLPSKTDFEKLIDNAGGNEVIAYKNLIPGGKSNFSIQFGGWYSTGSFGSIDKNASLWSSTVFGNDRAWYLYLYTGNAYAIIGDNPNHGGLSVRCIKDNR